MAYSEAATTANKQTNKQKLLKAFPALLGQPIPDKKTDQPLSTVRHLTDSQSQYTTKQDTLLLPVTSPNVERFSKSFTVRLSSKRVKKQWLVIPWTLQ